MSDFTFSHETVLERISKKFEGLIIKSDVSYNILTIEVESSITHQLIKWLKDDSILNLSFLTLIGGIHYPENKGKELGVVYHLHGLESNYRLRIKTFVSIENPNVDSIVDIYVGANWMERETFDFFGILFVGHPNLCRILNEENMDYFPMRKEYHLEDDTREDKDDRYFGR